MRLTLAQKQSVIVATASIPRKRRESVVMVSWTFKLIVMSNEKELAYRYDLFITPDWRDRFDTLINESIKIPPESRILDVDCGTGAHAIELAERLRGKGEVIGVDPSLERITLARAKAQVKKAENVTFEQSADSDLQFDSHEFDIVIGDASMLKRNEIPDVLAEMVRVARPDGRVILKLATHGSFDEFFSIYWEALHNLGLDNKVWTALEGLINERRTISDAELMATNLGLRDIKSFVSKEEFSYETAEDFLEAPLIKDCFLSDWLEFVPEASREEVRRRLIPIIERERYNAPFDVSIKATIIAGMK
jgi:ubiquinone/menaquinone biosynthesis C-methylase UbiE